MQHDFFSKQIYKIDGADDVPQITFDNQSFYVSIIGASYPEDAMEVYTPVFDWLEIVEEKKVASIRFDFDFTILSSASNKMVYEILVRLDQMVQTGIQLTINWYYEEFDEDLMEEGQNYQDSLSTTINLVVKE